MFGFAPAKDEKNPVPSSLYFYIYPVRFRKNTEMGREAGESVSRPYLWDPVFSRDNPVFFPYL